MISPVYHLHLHLHLLTTRKKTETKMMTKEVGMTHLLVEHHLEISTNLHTLNLAEEVHHSRRLRGMRMKEAIKMIH